MTVKDSDAGRKCFANLTSVPDAFPSLWLQWGPGIGSESCVTHYLELDKSSSVGVMLSPTAAKETFLSHSPAARTAPGGSFAANCSPGGRLCFPGACEENGVLF